MTEFDEAYSKLNVAQKKAVETIDGPLLVIAGPGTGKTQLLSVRVGHILKTTDTPPDSILCLTFTESGVQAMRERLLRFVGQDSYAIQISTYHSFGSDLLRRYPEYATSTGEEPVDELGMRQIIKDIISDLPFSNPYKNAELYAGDLLGFIGECKRALLSPELLREINKQNLAFIEKVSPVVSELFQDFKRVDKNSITLFEKLLVEISHNIDDYQTICSIQPLATLACQSLASALANCQETGKTTSLTAWKKQWLAKNGRGQQIFDGRDQAERFAAAIDIYQKYLGQLETLKLYDYDDMIQRAIIALEANPDFKLTLAERYLYIMLDEFQDTNPAQMRLIELLTDSPVNEQRPNIMAVGDDDQAIYAFQGADYSNMVRFLSMYLDVEVITLDENYRSHPDILHVAHQVAGQIESRLHQQIGGINKVLKAANQSLPSQATIARHEFEGDTGQYYWVSQKVKELIEKGTAPSEIAILAPKHQYLVAMSGYLLEAGLPVWYEKRENILDQPAIRQLETMSRLILALAENDKLQADSLWPVVLSYDFWQFSTGDIWQLSWQSKSTDWTSQIMESSVFKPVGEFFLRLKDLMTQTTLEQQLDLLVGVDAEHYQKTFGLNMVSPFYHFYFESQQTVDSFLPLLSDLTVLRSHLREFRRSELRPLNLQDLIDFIESYRNAGLPLLNTNPYQSSTQAVQLMTAYKSKGLEFANVFVIAAQDEVWGSSSRSRRSTVGLPINLSPIRYQAVGDDDLRRLFYVAITRAKHCLYITSYLKSMNGRGSTRLRYLMEEIGQDGARSTILPTDSQTVILTDVKDASASNLMLPYWQSRHRPPFNSSLKDLLSNHLTSYQLSPTHLNQFLDVVNGGPAAFFTTTILRFPKSPLPSGQFGSAIHETLMWAQLASADDKPPSKKRFLDHFHNQLESKRLAAQTYEQYLERGQEGLGAFWEQKANSFLPSDSVEYSFRNEGVFVGEAHLTGNIDRLVIDPKNKTITVVDYKTGKSFSRWDKSSLKLHKYRQQLMIYKILVEQSRKFEGFKVEQGKLIFVEPDNEGQITELAIDYQDVELQATRKLIVAVWRQIQKLDFPDISQYPPTISGVKQFENDLLQN